jgi:hypothetical protein
MARSTRTWLALGATPVLALALVSVGALAPSTTPAGAAGPSWSANLSPLPANAGAVPVASIDVTTCPSPGNCVAAGDYKDTAGHLQGMLEVLASGAWTAIEAPLPANAGTGFQAADFRAATCVAVGACTVVGGYRDTDNKLVALIETLSGGAWTATEAPLPANTGTDGDGHADSQFYGVACQGAGACVAVGSYVDTSGYDHALIDSLSGGAWAALQAPLPSNAGTDGGGTAYSELLAVQCPSSGQCVAVGDYNDTADSDYPLIETLSGGSWSPLQGPQPPNAGTGIDEGSYLNDVSCPSATVCVAVGQYQDTGAYGYPLIETLGGGAWSAVTGPLPGNAGDDTDLQNAFLQTVSCPTVGNCVAVGRYKDTNMYSYGLIDTLTNGGTWTGTTPQEPPNAGTDAGLSQLADLYGVSCSWPGQCVVVGTYQDASNHDHALIVSQTGGTWSSMESPYPVPISSSSPNAYLNDVSCVAAMCAAGGNFNDAANHQQGLLVTLVGSGGYDFSASDGGIFAYNSPFFGSMGGLPLNKPVVGITIDPATDGYFEVASDGGMFAFNAPFQGSMGGMPLNEPVVGMAFDTLTGGYYEVASDGGLFAFNAPFYGSMGGKPLNEPIVGIAFDSNTGGYYEVASDGGLFAFNAPFLGSMGGMPLNKPVVGMTFDSSTNGYYEVASDGGLFSFGAPFLGSTGNITLNKPVVGMAFDPYTNGYYEVATDGGIFAYGAPFWGSTGSITLNKPVVGMGTT